MRQPEIPDPRACLSRAPENVIRLRGDADEGRALADTLRSLGAEVEFFKADVRIEHLARDEARGCRTKDARFP